jgi:hypothetical protein
LERWDCKFSIRTFWDEFSGRSFNLLLHIRKLISVGIGCGNGYAKSIPEPHIFIFPDYDSGRGIIDFFSWLFSRFLVSHPQISVAAIPNKKKAPSLKFFLFIFSQLILFY